MSDAIKDAEKYLDDVRYYGGPDPSTVKGVQDILRTVLRQVKHERQQHAKLVEAARIVEEELDRMNKLTGIPVQERRVLGDLSGTLCAAIRDCVEAPRENGHDPLNPDWWCWDDDRSDSDCAEGGE